MEMLISDLYLRILSHRVLKAVGSCYLAEYNKRLA